MPFTQDSNMPQWWWTRWVLEMLVLGLVLLTNIGGCASWDAARKLIANHEQKSSDNSLSETKQLIDLKSQVDYLKGRQNDFNIAQIRLLDDVSRSLAQSVPKNTKMIRRTAKTVTSGHAQLLAIRKELKAVREQNRVLEKQLGRRRP